MGTCRLSNLVLVVFFLFVQSLTTQVSLCTNSSFVCVESERQALLKFKQSFFQDLYHRLSSWQGESCCRWDGVGCDEKTGHVTKLDIGLYEAIPSFNLHKPIIDWLYSNRSLRAREVDTSLVELRHLRHLDLGGNDFQQSNIPAFFGSMKHLKFLGLSHANFSGTIPRELGNLSSLRVLDLQNGYGRLRADTLEWASNLVSLRYLDMSRVVMTSVANTTMKVLSTLPSLSHLSLSKCELGDIIYQNYVNSTFFTGLEYLDLSENRLTRKSLGILRNMTSLQHLDLSHNSLSSSLPSFLRSFKSLVSLDLGWNDFDSIEGGGLLSILDSACSLKSLDLSINYIRSKVFELNDDTNTSSHSHCAKYDMEFLDLSQCEFSGPLSGWLEKLELLKYLDLSWNSFYGDPFPWSRGRISSLIVLDLSYNQLNGTIAESLGDSLMLTKLVLLGNQLTGDLPRSLGNLKHLTFLNIAHNSLQGTVSEAHLANLPSLKRLYIQSNNLTCKMSSDWIPAFSLVVLDMGGCKVVGSQFPEWLRTQNELTKLSLSNADIHGHLPNWLQGTTRLYSLDLSANQISGPLPSNFGASMPHLLFLSLGRNQINGSIPKSFCKLNLLYFLDLSTNMLSGEIPDCWVVYHMLEYINLSENELSGSIPISVGHLGSLMHFHVNNNYLNGELPLSLANCTALQLVDVGDNQFSGAIPHWIGESLRYLLILRLRNNMFTGNIPRELCTLSDLQILDLSHNLLGGGIPRCFSNLTGMTTAEKDSSSYEEPMDMATLSDEQLLLAEMVRQVMKGRELEYTSTVRFLSNIDLSGNELEGLIPEELCGLFGLKGLNLSHNHFFGNIPGQIGNLKSLESLDLSHNTLSGAIPSTMALLTMLAYLNISYNNLSGKVPTGNQLQTLNVDPSIYIGNPLLCGHTLPNKCSDDHEDDSRSTGKVHKQEHKEEDHKSDERIWFYSVVAVGYATGLWAVIGTLFLKRDWRIAYFRFADNAKDWIVVMVSVSLTRLNNKLFNNN